MGALGRHTLMMSSPVTWRGGLALCLRVLGAPEDSGLVDTLPSERTWVLEGPGTRWWSEIPADWENRGDRYTQRQGRSKY